MSKINLSPINNLQNEATVTATINNNNNVITAAIENSVSRNGIQPNQMNSVLDMNSNRIINLPDAVSDQEPVTYEQFIDGITSVNQGVVVDGAFILAEHNDTTINDRVLVAGDNLQVIDGGPKGDFTVRVSDLELNALASTVSAEDKLPYFTGEGTADVADFTAYARTLVDDEDAATARATLGLVLDTDVQPHDPTLNSLVNAGNGIMTKTAANTITPRTVTGTSNEITVTNGNGVSGNPTVSLPNSLTFTGKTVTGGTFSSPTINTPTGITKSDVGLSNVDNTSDATKNSASATLTNKTISGSNNTITNVPNASVVGLGSLALKNKATVPSDLSTTGTPDGTKFLRDDGQWTSIPGAGDLLSTNNLSDLSNANTALTNLGGTSVGTSLFKASDVNTARGVLALPGYLYGLVLSTAGSSSTFSVAAGFATDSTFTDTMYLSSSYSKTTSTWAVGSSNGSLDTGTVAANTWYHVFLIKRTDTGVVDVLISASATSPTLPTNYTLFRRIGAMKTDGSSKWTKFSQLGDEFLWDAAVVNVSTSPGTTAIQTLTVTTPPGVQTTAILNAAGIGTGDSRGWVFSPDVNSAGALASTGSTINFGGSGTIQVWSVTRVRTNTSAQVKYAMTLSSGQPIITTTGWIDDRGKL